MRVDMCSYRTSYRHSYQFFRRLYLRQPANTTHPDSVGCNNISCIAGSRSWLPSNGYLNRPALASKILCNNLIIVLRTHSLVIFPDHSLLVHRDLIMSDNVSACNNGHSHTQSLMPQIFYLWPAITYNVDFLVGHTLEDPLEREDAINWWLGLGDYTAITSTSKLNANLRIPTHNMLQIVNITHIGSLKAAQT